jgi:hypothetical protein
MFECVLLLVLDGYSESTDEFVVRDFDGKNLAGVISLDETVEFEESWFRVLWVCGCASNK